MVCCEWLGGRIVKKSKRRKTDGKWFDLFAGWGCTVMGAGCFAMLGPSIIQDFFTDADTLERAPEFRVAKAKCDTDMGFLSTCNFTFIHQQTSEKLRFDYMIFGRMDAANVYALKTPDGGYVTTNIGMETVQSRNWMATGFGSFMLFCGLFVLHQRREERRRAKGL